MKIVVADPILVMEAAIGPQPTILHINSEPLLLILSLSIFTYENSAQIYNFGESLGNGEGCRGAMGSVEKKTAPGGSNNIGTQVVFTYLCTWMPPFSEARIDIRSQSNELLLCFFFLLGSFKKHRFVQLRAFARVFLKLTYQLDKNYFMYLSTSGIFYISYVPLISTKISISIILLIMKDKKRFLKLNIQLQMIIKFQCNDQTALIHDRVNRCKWILDGEVGRQHVIEFLSRETWISQRRLWRWLSG